MNLVPLRRSEVRVGKRARFDIYDPHGNKLLSRGMLVASEGILERLLERGWRDADVMADAAQAAAPVATPFDRIDALCGELGGLHEIAATGSAPAWPGRSTPWPSAWPTCSRRPRTPSWRLSNLAARTTRRRRG